MVKGINEIEIVFSPRSDNPPPDFIDGVGEEAESVLCFRLPSGLDQPGSFQLLQGRVNDSTGEAGDLHDFKIVGSSFLNRFKNEWRGKSQTTLRASYIEFSITRVLHRCQ